MAIDENELRDLMSPEPAEQGAPSDGVGESYNIDLFRTINEYVSDNETTILRAMKLTNGLLVKSIYKVKDENGNVSAISESLAYIKGGDMVRNYRDGVTYYTMIGGVY